jgi:hypothetical protein
MSKNTLHLDILDEQKMNEFYENLTLDDPFKIGGVKGKSVLGYFKLYDSDSSPIEYLIPLPKMYSGFGFGCPSFEKDGKMIEGSLRLSITLTDDNSEYANEETRACNQFLHKIAEVMKEKIAINNKRLLDLKERDPQQFTGQRKKNIWADDQEFFEVMLKKHCTLVKVGAINEETGEQYPNAFLPRPSRIYGKDSNGFRIEKGYWVSIRKKEFDVNGKEIITTLTRPSERPVSRAELEDLIQGKCYIQPCIGRFRIMVLEETCMPYIHAHVLYIMVYPPIENDILQLDDNIDPFTNKPEDYIDPFVEVSRKRNREDVLNDEPVAKKQKVEEDLSSESYETLSEDELMPKPI